jgi:hypothetical protein
MKEIDQLHKRTCFAPLKVKEMKHSKRKKAQMALMFLTEKRDNAVCGILGSGEQTRIESCIIRIPESMVESQQCSPN